MDCLPPYIGGSITLMQNLMQNFDLNNCIAITPSVWESKKIGVNVDETTKVKIKKYEVRFFSYFFERITRYGLNIFNLFFSVPSIVLSIIKNAKKHKPKVIFSCWPSNAFAISAWIASKYLKLPLVFYLHDLWYETRIQFVEKKIVKYLERFIFKSASCLLVISEPTKHYLEKKYKLCNIKVLEHSVNSKIWDLSKIPNYNHRKIKKIIMLGGVNKFNHDSVKVFSKVIDSIGKLEMMIFSKQSIKDLKETYDISIKNINTSFIDRSKLHVELLKCDALYLPLGFNTLVKKEVEVVIPTRMMDYLPSGIPIITHGPGNTWMIKQAKSNGWAFVIDSNKKNIVENHLNSFLGMDSYDKLIKNSHFEAKRRDSKLISKKLNDVLIKFSN